MKLHAVLKKDLSHVLLREGGTGDSGVSDRTKTECTGKKGKLCRSHLL